MNGWEHQATIEKEQCCVYGRFYGYFSCGEKLDFIFYVEMYKWIRTQRCGTMYHVQQHKGKLTTTAK